MTKANKTKGNENKAVSISDALAANGSAPTNKRTSRPVSLPITMFSWNFDRAIDGAGDEGEKFAELRKDIRAKGQEDPVDATEEKNDKGEHKIVAGRRRCEALYQNWQEDLAKDPKTPIPEVFAILWEGFTEIDQLSRAFRENVFRRKLTPAEKCSALHMIYSRFEEQGKKEGLTGKKLASYASEKTVEETTMPSGTVNNSVRVAKNLCPRAQGLFKEGKITLEKAQQLAALSSKAQVEELDNPSKPTRAPRTNAQATEQAAPTQPTDSKKAEAEKLAQMINATRPGDKNLETLTGSLSFFQLDLLAKVLEITIIESGDQTTESMVNGAAQA